MKTVLNRLEAQAGPVDELNDGTLVIAVGVNTIYIKQQGDWAIHTRPRRSKSSSSDLQVFSVMKLINMTCQ